MVDRGYSVERHDGSAQSARRIITLLLYQPKIVLQPPPETIEKNLEAQSRFGDRDLSHENLMSAKSDSSFWSKLTHWMGYSWRVGIRVVPIAYLDFIVRLFAIDTFRGNRLPTVVNLLGWTFLLIAPYLSMGLIFHLPFVKFLRLY